MKRHILKYIIAILILTGTSCSDFDEINTNPNATTQVTSQMLASNMILAITRSSISNQKTFLQPFILGKYITWQEGGQESFQYNRLPRASFERLELLSNIKPMIGYAETEKLANSYTALGHFIRAWQFFLTTMQLGDIPYSEAILGETEGVIKPKYNTQKQVFQGILNELDLANELFAKGNDFGGDPIYNGDIDQWQRLANSFQLYVLINLSKKSADKDLNIIEKFKIVATRPLMRDANDNFALTFSDLDGQKYPWVNINSSNPSVIYPMLTANLLNPLKDMKDRRLFYFAKPSSVQITAGKKVSDWDAYPAAEASAAFASLQAMRASKDFTDLNDRYADLFNAEPVGLYTFWDLQFTMAEAAVRGWISESAKTFYEAGISSSMNFIATKTPNNPKYNHEMPITDSYIAAYLPTVALKGTDEARIQQILSQKYIAGFMHSTNYSAWFDNRRTGYPKFILNSSTNLNTPNTQFPVRWLYPSNEINYNGENMSAAVTSQFAGNDNTNGVMWLLKE
ncbi:SusD/RagB family nutrient-binding outer membrane lipoprotein [Dyadobacter sp. CY312]|uniref:SusD/RagB family nutrient-binding outer membrane lipoprotein n=1 Tax=Dyadobacter sp. CY312 TaxID=2907303 RepID=UPI001F3FB145|nr:SusD/RagB family nutrient-binding outer membrane lipoprotein [Dyadobacter sp. CY312]MCE7040128.1 SusD/RagB family nutrient-binding outer membrane lipoprotein [Dyadobacter sp. CY312]